MIGGLVLGTLTSYTSRTLICNTKQRGFIEISFGRGILVISQIKSSCALIARISKLHSNALGLLLSPGD